MMDELKIWHMPQSGKSVVALVINLERASERLAATRSHFEERQIPLNRIEAVYGRDIQFPIADFSEISYRLLHGRRTTPAEIGCYLSHVKCAQRLIDSDQDYALICEDDVYFQSDFAHVLDRALLSSGDWDILRLTTVNNHKMFSFKALDETHSLAIAMTRKKGAGAYVINRRAAKWITQKLLPMRLAYDIAFDLEFLAGLKAAFIHPLPAHQNREQDTQVQIDLPLYKLPRWRYFTVLPYRAWLEVSRFICRGLRLTINSLRYKRSVIEPKHLNEQPLN